MKSKLYFIAGAASFMMAGAVAGSYATLVGLHKVTDGETTRDLGWALGGVLSKTMTNRLFPDVEKKTDRPTDYAMRYSSSRGRKV